MYRVKNLIIMTVLIVLVTFSVAVQAEDEITTGWQKSLMADITTTQTSYSDSWVGGEAGSVNWVANLNGSAEKQLKKWLDYKSTLKLSFGQTITQDENNDWGKPKKSTDLIDWENVGLITMKKWVEPYVAFRLESQFYDGSDDRKKLYFSPLRLTESAGISRKFYKKEKDVIMSRLGLALRQTFKSVIIDDMLNTGDSTLTDGGLESVTDVSLTLHKNMKYTSKLTLYKALFFSESDEVKGTPYEDDWKAVDVNWENIISASVTKIVTVNLYLQFLYDKQIVDKGRLKETLALGVVFNLI